MHFYQHLQLFSLMLFQWSESRRMYVPSIDRTAGAINWFFHSDLLCNYDAQLQCQNLYNNGRLLVLESDEIVQLYDNRINRTRSNSIRYHVGLYDSQSKKQWWPTCEVWNSSSTTTSSILGTLSSPTCYTLIDHPYPFYENLFFLERMACNNQYPYICEAFSQEQTCKLENVLDALATLTNIINEDDCDNACRLAPDCWGLLYIDSRCILMRNMLQNVNMGFVMKRKDCLQGVHSTNVQQGSTCVNSKSTPIVSCSSDYEVPTLPSSFSSTTHLCEDSPICQTLVNPTSMHDTVSVIQTATDISVIATTVSEDDTAIVCDITHTVTEFVTESRRQDVAVVTSTMSQVTINSHAHDTPRETTQCNETISTVAYDITHVITDIVTLTSTEPAITVVQTVNGVVIQPSYITVSNDITHVLTEFVTVTAPGPVMTRIQTVNFEPSYLYITVSEIRTAVPNPVTVTENSATTLSCFNTTHNITTEQLEKKIVEMVKELTVNKSTTGASIRKLISAKDNRPSAQAVGFIGIVFLALPFCVMVIADIPRFLVGVYSCFCKK